MTAKYFIRISKLPFQYFGFTSEVYNILDKTKQIQNFENMYQPGSIKNVYDSKEKCLVSSFDPKALSNWSIKELDLFLEGLL